MIEVHIHWGPEACPYQEKRQETRLAAVDVTSEGSDSNKFDARKGSDAEAGESDELMSIPNTFEKMGSKGGRSGNVGSNSGRGLYTGNGLGSS